MTRVQISHGWRSSTGISSAFMIEATSWPSQRDAVCFLSDGSPLSGEYPRPCSSHPERSSHRRDEDNGLEPSRSDKPLRESRTLLDYSSRRKSIIPTIQPVSPQDGSDRGSPRRPEKSVTPLETDRFLSHPAEDQKDKRNREGSQISRIGSISHTPKERDQWTAEKNSQKDREHNENLRPSQRLRESSRAKDLQNREAIQPRRVR